MSKDSLRGETKGRNQRPRDPVKGCNDVLARPSPFAKDRRSMKRTLVWGSCLTLALLVAPAWSDEDAKSTSREALKELNDFIGQWKGTGTPEKNKKDFWTETIDWSWRFKGDDAWIMLEIKNGKYLKSGEMRYLTDKKRYQLTAVDLKDNKMVFEGELKDGTLTLTREDDKTKESQRLVMNLAAEGIRFNYYFERRPEDRKQFVREYKVESGKVGESLGASAKKTECVVSGGLGTIPVSYKGETFYVCCSGCRDAFNENPDKYIAEYKARKAGK
jgi:hypothetical protein